MVLIMLIRPIDIMWFLMIRHAFLYCRSGPFRSGNKRPSSLFTFRGFLHLIGTALRRFSIHSEQVECGKSLGRSGWLRFLHCSAPFFKNAAADHPAPVGLVPQVLSFLEGH